MKRWNIFEFIDFPWFPSIFRDPMTDAMYALHRIFRTYRVWTQRIADVLKKTGYRSIIDLGSGSGGPAIILNEKLGSIHSLSISTTLTDLFPNKTSVESVNASNNPRIRYFKRSVDATNVPKEFDGIRTMIGCFHHMNPSLARRILENAFLSRKPICIFEITENSLLALLFGVLLTPIIFVLTPFFLKSKPSIIFILVMPVVAIIGLWDMLMSFPRTYSPEDLRELTNDLKSEDYLWDIGSSRRWLIRMPYLIGMPQK